MSDTITVGLDVEGYDVEVEICADCIERNIEKLERKHPERINEDGTHFLTAKLSKFAAVQAEPTEEKWDELAEEGVN